MKGIKVLLAIASAILKNKLTLGLVLGLFASVGAKAATLFDDFNDGVIDTNLWAISLPLGVSQAFEAGGRAVVIGRGGFDTKQSFSNSIEVQGRFKFTGTEDHFSVAIRSDLSLTPTFAERRGIVIKFSDNGQSVRIIEYSYTNIVDMVPGKTFTFLGNTDYDFRITDDGTTVRLYMTNSITPILEGSSLFRAGNKISLYNREYSYARSEIDFIDIKDAFCSPHRATATATVVNGFVVGATITDGGCGYTNAPQVLIQGGGGSGATATATISNGVVVAINVTSAGCCYTNVPEIEIASPPFVPTLSITSPSHRATATATLVNGFVVGATITDGGYGYTNTPQVLVQGGGGSGATATAVISNGVVVAINIISAGCCYTSVPDIVLIGSPVSKVQITQNVVLGRNYVLESSTDLTNWTAVGPPFTATSESITDEFDVDVTVRFFRIRQVP